MDSSSTETFLDKINQQIQKFANYTKEDFLEKRKNVLLRFVNLLESKTKKNVSLLKELEQQIFQYSIQFISESDPFGMMYYIDKYIEIYQNLDPTQYIKNDFLLKNLLSGYITPSQIVFGDKTELFPERWEQNRKNIDAVQELKRKNDAVSTTDIYQCHKCGQRKCTYTERQIRSSDEPITVFVKCTVCGNAWKCNS
jgi:hypothetical protein